jgi:hypothetical protein
MASAVNPVSKSNPSFSSASASNQEIEGAKKDIFDFFISDRFIEIVGDRSAFKDALVAINKHAGNKPEIAFAKGLGAIFSELIEQAYDNRYIDAKTEKVFFDDSTDQVAFVTDLSNRIIAFVNKSEEIDGVPIAPSEDEVSHLKAEFLAFLKSESFSSLVLSEQDGFGLLIGSLDSFKELLAKVQSRSNNDVEAFFIDDKESQEYCGLFDALIREGVESGDFSKNASAVYSNPKFDQFNFIKDILAQLQAK